MNTSKGEATRYVRLGGMSVAELKGTDITYLHSDHLGTPVAGSDENGNILWRETYTPYGEVYGGEDAARENAQGFTGHIRDTATGLTYMQAQYYTP